MTDRDEQEKLAAEENPPTQRRWKPLPLLLVAVGILLLALAPALFRQQAERAKRPPEGAPTSEQAVVSLRYEWGEAREPVEVSVAWQDSMTVLDAMQEAAAQKPELRPLIEGQGAQTFVHQIGDVRNEGGGANARNWIYRVNGRLAPDSAAVHPLAAGDVVLWRFETYDEK